MQVFQVVNGAQITVKLSDFPRICSEIEWNFHQNTNSIFTAFRDGVKALIVRVILQELAHSLADELSFF